MAAFDHWLPLHVGDYLADTMHLSTLQHGIYIRLIMHYWKRRGLPNDERALARIAGVATLKFRIHAGPVLALFTVRPPDENAQKPPTILDSKIDSNPEGFDSASATLSHKRLDAEIARAMGISEARKAAGTLGGKASKRASPAPERARDSTTTPTKNPPHKPPGGGRRGGREMGWGESFLADQERLNGEPTIPHPGGPRVVSILGRAVVG